jgi:hypothetical protein
MTLFIEVNHQNPNSTSNPHKKPKTKVSNKNMLCVHKKGSTRPITKVKPKKQRPVRMAKIFCNNNEYSTGSI